MLEIQMCYLHVLPVNLALKIGLHVALHLRLKGIPFFSCLEEDLYVLFWSVCACCGVQTLSNFKRSV